MSVLCFPHYASNNKKAESFWMWRRYNRRRKAKLGLGLTFSLTAPQTFRETAGSGYQRCPHRKAKACELQWFGLVTPFVC